MAKSADHYRNAIKQNWSMNLGKAVRAMADEQAQLKIKPPVPMTVRSFPGVPAQASHQ
jgi:hypothetical protein